MRISIRAAQTGKVTDKRTAGTLNGGNNGDEGEQSLESHDR